MTNDSKEDFEHIPTGIPPLADEQTVPQQHVMETISIHQILPNPANPRKPARHPGAYPRGYFQIDANSYLLTDRAVVGALAKAADRAVTVRILVFGNPSIRPWSRSKQSLWVPWSKVKLSATRTWWPIRAHRAAQPPWGAVT